MRAGEESLHKLAVSSKQIKHLLVYASGCFVIPLSAILGHEETRSPCGRGGYFFFGWRLRR